MNAPVSITASIDQATSTMVADLARSRGISEAEFAAEAIRKVAVEETEFRTYIQVGLDDIEAGRVYTQEEVEAWFEARYRDASAA